MASKKALDKAYDAGQAAKMRGLEADVNPFDEVAQEDEYVEWEEGRTAKELDPKWTNLAGVNHNLEISQ